MSTIKVDTVKSSVAGVAPVIRDLNGVEVSQGCTAWVNFNGTGVVAIRGSFNVSGITDNGVGAYTVNFSTPMANSNFSAVCSGRNPSNGSMYATLTGLPEASATTASLLRVRGSNGANTYVDLDTVCVAVFGGK